MRNADLSEQFANQQQDNNSSSLIDVDADKLGSANQAFQELKKDPDYSQSQQDASMTDQIDSSTTKTYKLLKNGLVKIVTNNTDPAFLNAYTGNGSIVTRCKHYAHLSCLNKFLNE